MADRLLREQAQAFQQRLSLIESRLRALGLRAWPGAVRSEQSLDSFTPTVYSTESQILSLSVPAGRWIVLASATIATSTVDAAGEAWTLSVAASDPVTGDALPVAAFDNPSAYLWLPPNDGSSTMYSSMTLTGDLRCDESALLTLAVADAGGRAFTVVKPRLRMLPV
jgi:hypothetical protein